MLKKNILRRKSDFSGIYKRGKSKGDQYVVLFYRKNGLSYSRTAFLASKKVGNAVKRNRARRLMKEAYRLTNIKLKDGYDYVIIARKTIVNDNVKCRDVQRSLESVFKRSGVTRKNEVHKRNTK